MKIVNCKLKIKKGFTLIETLVVIAVIGITLPILISIILILMRQQLKIYRLSQVKKEGDYIISIIQATVKDQAFTIHNAKPASESNIVCDDPATGPYSSTSSLYFLDKNSNWFGYEFINDSIASSSSLTSNNLTSSKILVESFSISCLRNKIFSPPYIMFSFDVCYYTGGGGCDSTRPEETATLHYQSRVKLRNF